MRIINAEKVEKLGEESENHDGMNFSGDDCNYCQALDDILKEAVEIPKYTPAIYDSQKHMPTDTEVELQEKNLKRYKLKCGFQKVNDYDFRRGWEYGFGEALKLLQGDVK